MWVIAGRRSGKSIIAALYGVTLALFHDYRGFLGPGERATVMLIAGDKRQARVLMRYVRGLIDGSPMLKRMIESETAESINFNNRTVIEISVANPRATRGYTLAGVICDEIATWPSDETSPKRDEDTLAALRPALITIPSRETHLHHKPLRPQGRGLERLSQALRPGRKQSSGLAIRYANPQPRRRQGLHRRSLTT